VNGPVWYVVLSDQVPYQELAEFPQNNVPQPMPPVPATFMRAYSVPVFTTAAG